MTTNDLDGSNQVVAKVLGHEVTRGELSKFFELVVPRDNWKNPINAIVDLRDRDLYMIREAVIFFTGSVPQFIPCLGAKMPKCRYRVIAAGYYRTIGA